MKKLYFFLMLGILILLSFATDNALAKPPSAEQMLFNSAQGKDFWIAIPPNEDDKQPIGNTYEIALEIYVTSTKNCDVTMEIPGVDQKVTKKVTAYNITTFTSLKNDLTFGMEVRESEKILIDKGIHVYATQPVSVYVLCHRNVSADGYLAIPISACGTDYIHLAYYDFHEDMYGGEFRGGGFLITAAENNTRVNIQLKGVGGAVSKTWGDHKIGDQWSINMNRGEVYCVMGSGATRGQFDLSGSRVTSNKPIGFISFHKRTLIPSFDLYNGRNMLCEMMPPVTAWGKKYATVEFKRKGRGDFFRIIASQDNTNFNVKWYELGTGRLVSQRSQLLKKSGDFAEYEEVFVPQSTPNTMESIKGTSVWEADKPVCVMQYSYSTDWDNAPEFDPFMILVVPVEQFIPSTVFQTPDQGAGFLTNHFNIIAVGDTNDPAQTKLQTIKIDGKPVWQLEPQFLFNRIPTTNLYWAKLNVSTGAHRVTGDTKFGGYIYGFGSADGYGWPAAMAFNKVDETDTLPPELYKTGDCGDYDLRTTEFRNGKVGDDPRQVDQGVQSIELVEGSYNYNLVMIDSLITYPPMYEVRFALKLIDRTQKGYALLAILDRAGNFTLDSVFYNPAGFTVTPNPIAFGNVRLKTTKSQTIKLTNSSDSVIQVKQISLLKGTYYKIVSGGAPPEFNILPGETHDVVIEYTPLVEGITPDQKDFDSLLVQTRCIPFKWQIEGRGVIPKILVEDHNFGSVVVNKKACKETQTGTGLKIQNVGSDTLKIFNIKNFAAPFELSTPFTPALPIIIPPGAPEVYLVSVCFAPTATGPFTQDILFESNAEGVDSIANLKGLGIIPGPYVTSKNWYERRVKTVNDSVVFIRNSGTSKVTITGINLGTASSDFIITGAVPMPSQTNPVDLIPQDSTNGVNEIVVNVRFVPQAEGTFTNKVVPEFDPGEGIPAGTVFGNLDGVGILPKIEVTGYDFQPTILVGTKHPTQGNVTIKSTSTSADLWVEEIRWKNPGQTIFNWVSAPPSKFSIPRGTQIQLPVEYNCTAVGDQLEIVEVVNDASEGPDPNPRVITPADVIGHGYDKGLVVDSLNFGTHYLCDQPTMQFHITNTGTTSAATVYSLVLVSGDAAAFELVSTTPLTVGPGATYNFDVKFKPYKRTPLTYTAVYRVLSSVDSNQYVLLQGASDSMMYRVSLKKFATTDKLQPGKDLQLDVSAELTKGAWTDAKITSFHMEITYNKEWMIYSKSIDRGEILDNSWNLTAKEEVLGNGLKRLSIDGNGTTPIAANGILVKPHFMLLLFESYEFVPWVDTVSMSLGSRDACINRTSIPGYVVTDICVKNIRNILTTSTDYALYDIDPNPVSGGTISVNYSVGLKGMTKIDIINSMGEVIQNVMNSEKGIGVYKADIDISTIASGNYFVRMQSGPFINVKQLIIAK